MTARRPTPATGSSVAALVLAGAMFTACSRADKTASTDSSGNAVPATVIVAPPGTTMASVSDTAGCGLVAKSAHDNPDSLLAEYLRRDGDGEFATSSSWRDLAVYCPLQSPGWDGFTLVSAYRTTLLSRSADSLRVVVQYSRVGLLEQDSAGYMVKPDVAQETDTATLARTPYGWRVYGWDQEPHLLPSGALKLPTMKAADRRKLQAMLAR